MIVGSRIGIKELKNGRIVTQDRDFYRVDGYLMDGTAIPADTAVPFELEMECFNLQAWQEVVHDNGSDCTPPAPPPRPPLLLGPRPPIIIPIECGALTCSIETTTWTIGEVTNIASQEWCRNPLVDRATFEQQSTNDYENAGVWADLC